MNVHKNARLTVAGRGLLVERVSGGWTVQRAAAGISRRTAHKWLDRYRRGGTAALADRSSAPRRCPHRMPAERLAQIEQLRRQRLSGPRIARALQLARSSVGLVLRRLGLGRLASLDERPAVIRYERQRPGEMLHLDIKSLGRIARPGHRVTGNRRDRVEGIGWEHLHVAIDDASRLAQRDL